MSDPATSDPATPERPTAAGMYDYYLGGTAYSPVDRAAAERVVQLIPPVVDSAWANRGFLQRAVTRMAAEWGIRQFIDLGSGLPTQRNTHEVVAALVPDGCVVYVDIDPVAVARGGEFVSGVPGAAMIAGDVREPDRVLADVRETGLIDFTAPVGILMVALLHFVPDDEDPARIVSRYLDAVPSGSYLALSHGSSDHQLDEQARRNAVKLYESSSVPYADRSKTEIERFFRGLEIVPPYGGAAPELTFVGLWGAEDPAAADSEGSRWLYAAVARKP